MTKLRARRSHKANRAFLSAIYWVGIALVLTFLFWTFVLVLWQAAER